MSRFRVCGSNDLNIDSVRQVVLPDGTLIALYRIAEGYFATADLCTHGAGSLSEGDIDNDEIVCPFHGGTFAIKTGEPIAAPCVIPIRTYLVVVDGDVVYIEL